MEMNKKITFYRYSIWILIVLLPILTAYFFYSRGIELHFFCALACSVILVLFSLLKNYSFFRNADEIIKPLDFRNESVIVEGKAKKIKGSKRIEGILYLTNTNIIFDAKDSEISVLNLEKIESVNLFCIYGFLNRGIVIKRVEGEADHFILKYAKDWKRIIDCSIQEAISKNY